MLIFHVAAAQITYETVFVDYDSAWQFKNLKLIPIRSKGGGPGSMSGSNSDIISLKQGLKTGILGISERGSASTENVHWLRLNNKSKKTCFCCIGRNSDRGAAGSCGYQGYYFNSYR